MSRIPDEIIDQVRDATDLLALVQESVDLKRTGSDWRGPCPFHGGVHRNFAVVPRKNVFYCFVCHEKGDAFSYLMKRFGMDYPTAVRELARRAGITVPERQERVGPDPNEPLYAAMNAAHDWFAARLREAPEAAGARQYLEGRDVPLEVAQTHGLGFAPGGPAFLEAMKTLGVPPDALLAAGLTIRRDDGSVYPRFRDRLLFPIHDLRGRVVGFGGRLLGPGEPKYLNSPESEIFHKGRMLYNLHHARQAIRQAQAVIVVEGYFDVLRLGLVGIDHVVAPLGTALTPEQAALLKRYAPTAILLYDSDTAGLKATFRAGDELLRHAVRVRVATMPEGEDPDTLARTGGAAAIEGILDDAVDVLERKLQLLERRGWFTDVERRREALDRLLPTVRAAADPITRDLYLGAISERTGVSRDVLEREAEKGNGARGAGGRAAGGPGSGYAGAYRISSPDRPSPDRPTPSTRPTAFPGRGAEETILAIAATEPSWRERLRAEAPPARFLDPAHRRVAEGLASAVDVDVLLGQLEGEARARLEALIALGPSRRGSDPDDAWAVAMEELDARPHLERYEQLGAQIRAADDPRKAELLQAQLEVRRQLQASFPRVYQKRFHQRGARSARRPPLPES